MPVNKIGSMLRNKRRLPSYIKMSFLIHATEDPEKVLKAVRYILPEEHFEDVEYEKNVLLGYHKNPIIMVKTSIKGGARALAVLKRILQKLEEDDMKLLSSEFPSHLDSRGNLYMRLDKQEALLGKIKLCSVDPIRIKAKFNFIPTTVQEIMSISEI